MKFSRFLPLPLIAAASILLPVSLPAQIVNIDFLSVRGTDTPGPDFSGELVATNYGGHGAADTGTTFNGLTADDSSESDDLTVNGTNLKSSTDGNTSVGFSISQVGADHPPMGSGGILTGNDAYVFIQDGLTPLSVTFTISGLGTATEADLFFYTSNQSGLAQGVFTLSGGAQHSIATDGIYDSSNTIEFIDVPVVSGSITGTFTTPQHSASILSGLTVEAIPEPSTWAMMSLGAAVLLWRLRRCVAP